MRIIDAEFTVKAKAGKQVSHYRLATTLADHRQGPATEMIGRYLERWEIESSFQELKSTMLGGRVLRARTVDGLEQETWAFLVAYRLLRTAMADATNTVDRLDADRASFSIALDTAQNTLIQAANTTIDARIDQIGKNGRDILQNLLPEPRLRVCPPHRQSSHLQVPGMRIQVRPNQLPGHHRHLWRENRLAADPAAKRHGI
ncbi:transposase [Paeniglutamicibacter sp. ORCA_105]|uniref:transposase n=1 Tax=Paeniglutamicibacter sp. ORCA_105 TaxID=3377336 RepID=UPI00389302D8